MRPVKAGLYFAMCAIIALPLWAQAPTVCATSEEYEALNMRALQSELMVAALSCNQERHYKWYVKEFAPQLKFYRTALKDFFSRNGATKPDKLMEDFLTHMANRASRSSLSRPQEQYCGEVGTLYGALQQGKFGTVVGLANQFYAQWHHVPLCNTAPGKEMTRE